jgi:penicillin V acylase-like amidase (Ntn superfamily)
VSDRTNKRYYFEFTDMPNVVWIDLDKLNLEEGAPIQAFDMVSDINVSGEVSGKFRPTKPIDFYKEGSTLDWKPTPKSR